MTTLKLALAERKPTETPYSQLPFETRWLKTSMRSFPNSATRLSPMDDLGMEATIVQCPFGIGNGHGQESASRVPARGFSKLLTAAMHLVR